MSVVSQTTEALGIFQGDLLIKKAIEAGLQELRDQSWLQDYVMAGLLFDPLSNDNYGAQTIARFREWFNATDIPVLINARLGDVETTAVSINLGASDEEENTLADLHIGPTQETVPASQAAPWPALTPQFTPQYIPATGVVILPANVQVQIFPGMVIVDAAGTAYPILSAGSNSVFTIATGLVPDFRQAVIKGGSPSVIQTLESAVFHDRYVVGCHIGTDAEHLMFLHSVVLFVLMRGRQVYFEARGWDRMSLTSSDFLKNEQFDRENVWQRYITVSGYSRHVWPKARFPILTGTGTQVRVIDGAKLPPDAQPASAQNWTGDKDTLGGG